MNYLQKKKQAIIMMLAAHILKTAEGYPLTVNDCESGSAVDYTVWGNTATGKNLISYPYIDTTKTVNGITFTDNGDGTVTANGTATGEAVFRMSVYTLKEGVTYYLSGCPKGGSKSTYYFWFRGYNRDEGNGVKIPVTYDFTNNTEIVISKGAVLDNLIFKPQLEIGTAATEYEPYTEKYVGDKTLVSDNTYKYKIPLANSGKNLLPYPYYQTTKTENGITFTDNGDGSITVNGTATADTWFILQSYAPLNGEYTLSGCKNGSKTTYILGLGSSDSADVGNGVTATITAKANIFIRVYNGAVLDNVIFKPQLELGTNATEYEPYRVPATANIYLDEPLKKGESVNFGTDRLPELQLFEGSNIITADTEVKPEKIVVDYYAKESD